MNSISITWNGHSCFTVEKDGFSIVFDPYGPNTVPDSLRFPSPQT